MGRPRPFKLSSTRETRGTVSRFCRRAIFSSCIVLTSSVLAFDARADTIFCLSDGAKIVARSFETRDGKFYFTIPGSQNPLEYPASMVKAINVPECPSAPQAPSSAAAPGAGRFGIHGSNTIGERLMPMLIDAYAQQRLGSPATKKAPRPEEQEITLQSGSSTRAVIDFRSHGSGTSAKGLLSGAALIGMSSRRANVAERADISASFNLDIWAPENEHVLALDGLAVIVNSSNPVTSLSLDQIARIFSGATTNWSEVGGVNAPIRVLRRDEKSGTFDTFKGLVLEPVKMEIAPTAQRFESSENLSDEVAKDANAIGFIGLPYVNANRALKLSSSCGLSQAPTRFSIKSEQYPLARRLFLYTLGSPSEPTARELLQFALSDSVQPTVIEAGFIDQAIEYQDEGEQREWVGAIGANPLKGLDPKAEVPRNFERALLSALENDRRSSIVFRFETGSARLDTRAFQDVQRLARYVSGQNAQKVYLAGFADSKGSWRRNLELAAERASTVAFALAEAGVRIPKSNIFTMSYLAPVACNDTDLGMAKNRRVEVWIRR